MSNSWFIIANSTSGNRNFSKQWKEIEQLLKNLSNDEGKSFFTLPDSDDYQKIPNDPKNPITEEKNLRQVIKFL